MLKKLTVRNFKSLADVTVEFAPLTVLFGPNASGKSNLLEAITALSGLATAPTLGDVLNDSPPIRGYAFESAAFPAGGVPTLLKKKYTELLFEAELGIDNQRYRYRIQPRVELHSGKLSVSDEFLSPVNGDARLVGRPVIEREGNVLKVRTGKRGHPYEEQLGMDHSVLSGRYFTGADFSALDAVRTELGGWRSHYLDPVLSMRALRSPADVTDIGAHGEDLAPFLYKLYQEKHSAFIAIERTLRTIVPEIESVKVPRDERGLLDVVVRQGGVEFSSRVISDGTLRVLALCAVAVNPWSSSVIAFEEPETGLHPRRLDLVAEMLHWVATVQNRQVIVTTHSPRFCDEVLKRVGETPGVAGLVNVRRGGGATITETISSARPLLGDAELERELASAAEDRPFENLLLRGFLDE